MNTTTPSIFCSGVKQADLESCTYEHESKSQRGLS